MIPCKYVIAKFVEDEIRDEPINIGVILQSQNDFRILNKFNVIRNPTHYSKLKIILLKEMISKIYADLLVLDSNPKNIFDDILLRYDRILVFSKPRTVLTDNLEVELNQLFNTFISKKYTSERNMFDNKALRKKLFKYFRTTLGNKVHAIKENVSLVGQVYRNEFDLAIIRERERHEKDIYFQTVSFDVKSPIQKIKLFDVGVQDMVKSESKLRSENFCAIISPPLEISGQKEEEEAKMEEFKEGREILEKKNYPWINYKEDNLDEKIIKLLT